MKKSILPALIILTLGSCSHNYGDYGESYINVEELKNKTAEEITKEDIQANVASIFGATDPNQDWKLLSTGTIKITADADLNNIVKVQILSEPPYLNPEATVLNEASVSSGQTVELSYDIPTNQTRLTAACVNSDGVYFTKGFDIGTTSINFSHSSNTRAYSRGSEIFPELNSLKLECKNSFYSYGAMRNIKANSGETSSNENVLFWKDRGFENERLWRTTDNTKLNNVGWNMSNNTIYRQAEPLSSEEKAELQDIFNKYLGRAGENGDLKGRQSNLEIVRNTPIFSMENNYLTSNGKPLIISPVLMASTENKYCHIYYYYFNPNDLAGMSSEEEARYIKNLPKFKAMQCNVADLHHGEFSRDQEYLLPYYGDAPLLKHTVLSEFTTDGKIYRIRNGHKYQNQDYYIRYLNNENYRLVEYDDTSDKSTNQLWQIFKNNKGECYLYNIGSHSFLTASGDWNTTFSSLDCITPTTYPFKLDDKNHLFRTDKKTNCCLGSDLDLKSNYGIWSDKSTGKDQTEWFFEEATYTRGSLILKKQIESVNSEEIIAQSLSIPEGYKVGFMMRKQWEGENDCYNHYENESYNGKHNGELYADGRLNTEINRFPDHFLSSKTLYHMQDDDPRIAVFGANKKIYLTFEDGADCQMSDLIVEVSNGLKEVDGSQQVSGQKVTFCFEDRKIGDYDLNDVVIKAERINLTQVKYSLVACGATDELYLRNINGNVLNENTEIHAYFGVPTSTFVNTQNNPNEYAPIEETITVDPTFTFSDFSKQIYIYNKTQGYDIRLSELGDVDPHAIVIPINFSYPKEKSSIVKAYPLFKNWVTNSESDTDWYNSGIDENILTE